MHLYESQKPQDKEENPIVVTNENVLQLLKIISTEGESGIVYIPEGIGSLPISSKVTIYGDGDDDDPEQDQVFVAEYPSNIPIWVGDHYGSFTIVMPFQPKVKLDKGVAQPIGIKIEQGYTSFLVDLTDKIQQHSPKLHYDLSDSNSRHSKGNVIKISNLEGTTVQIDISNKKNTSKNETYISFLPKLTLNPHKPFGPQLSFFLEIMNIFYQTFPNIEGQVNQIDNNAYKKILDKVLDYTAQKIKSLDQNVIKKALEQSINTDKEILENFPNEAYNQWVTEKNKERTQLLQDPTAEPNHETSYPFEDLAKYDFLCQAYVSAERSNYYSNILSRLLAEQGQTLQERVVKIHYINIASFRKTEHISQYELLTANLKKIASGSQDISDTFEVSVGSTHDHIWDSWEKRLEEQTIKTWSDDELPHRNSGIRGICLETMSGKKYLILEVKYPNELESVLTGVSTVDERIAKKIDKIEIDLLHDLLSRYGLTLISNSYSEEAMQKIVYTEFMRSALPSFVARLEEELGRKLETSEIIRITTHFKAGLPFSIDDILTDSSGPRDTSGN